MKKKATTKKTKKPGNKNKIDFLLKNKKIPIENFIVSNSEIIPLIENILIKLHDLEDQLKKLKNS